MAVGDAYVFPGFPHQYLHNFSFQSHRLLFSHASAEVRGENTPESKFASTGDRTHNHQVMSPTRSPLSEPGGTKSKLKKEHNSDKKNSIISLDSMDYSLDSEYKFRGSSKYHQY